MVKRYVELVRENVRCEQPIRKGLDVVMEGMLVVDAQQRFTAQAVSDRLRGIVEEQI
jgi:hypothetical protein